MNITHISESDLTLKQLYKEREKIIEFNKKLSAPGYKFKNSIKPHYPRYLDALIETKKNGLQLKLF